MTTQRADVVVVGAGIIGLATARRHLQRHPSHRVVVLEREVGPAHHQTGRNSGVLHSGIYYRPGSYKARMAVRGRSAMVAFCEEKGIDYEICGKVIVATGEHELARLDDLGARALANGVEAERIGPERLAEIEPHAAGIAALWVSSTGIVSYREVCDALAADIVTAGGQVVYGAGVADLTELGSLIRLSTSAGDWETPLVVNCAGLRCDQLADMVGAAEGNRIVPFRGEYFEVVPERRHLVKGLIYPVPDPSFPFLGVHLTRMIDGSIHAGPNAVLALSREGYRWRDVSLRQMGEHLTNRGLWRLARQYWRTGAGEVWRSVNKGAFVRALQRLVPEIRADDLEVSPAGVRAQAMDGQGALLDDFAITETTTSVNVINAPSPAATASLEIADEIGRRLDERVS